VSSYQLDVVNGVVLDTEIEEEAELQQGKGGVLARTVKLRLVNGSFDKDLNQGKAVAARSSLSPYLGSEITISGYAEALSTAVLMRGTGWTDLLARFPETEGLYVGPDRVLHCSTGLARYFQPYSEVLCLASCRRFDAPLSGP
jgi:hypothetical protein